MTTAFASEGRHSRGERLSVWAGHNRRTPNGGLSSGVLMALASSALTSVPPHSSRLSADGASPLSRNRVRPRRRCLRRSATYLVRGSSLDSPVDGCCWRIRRDAGDGGAGHGLEARTPCARGPYAALPCCQCQHSRPTQPRSVNSPAVSQWGNVPPSDKPGDRAAVVDDLSTTLCRCHVAQGYTPMEQGRGRA